MRNFTKRIASILILTGMLLAAAAQAQPIAQVLVVKGEVAATDAQNKTRALARGATVQAGDTLYTGTGAAAQIRFVDGAVLSMREKSAYRVDDYRYSESDIERNVSLTTFLQGSIRTVTGLIAKLRPLSYKVRTPVASLGVRGTSYDALLSNGLYIAVWRGTVVIENNRGTTLVGEGTPYKFAFVSSIDSAPELSLEPPPLLKDLTGTTTDILSDPAGALPALPDPNLDLPPVPTVPDTNLPPLPPAPSPILPPVPEPSLPKLPL